MWSVTRCVVELQVHGLRLGVEPHGDRDPTPHAVAGRQVRRTFAVHERRARHPQLGDGLARVVTQFLACAGDVADERDFAGGQIEPGELTRRGLEVGEAPPQQDVSDRDVQQLVQRIRDRVLRALRKAGKWVDPDAAAAGGDGVGDELLPGLAAAAVEGRAALGERDGRIGRDGRWEPLVKGPLCASGDGFSLHAGAWVAARDREKLEKLCRYAARPAVAESRLVELADGRIG